MARVKKAPAARPAAEPEPRTEPASDLRPGDRAGLHAILAPRRVAVIGATDRPATVGRTITWNLLTNPFGGVVFPVNPNRSSVVGIKAYPDIASVPERVDLAVIATPAARRGRMRIIGPNCLGVMNPLTGLNATFASAMARPGQVAFVSQSGALCTVVLDWSLRENVGFSAFVSIGSMVDVEMGRPDRVPR